MRHRVLLAAAVTSVFALAACDGGGATAPGDSPLTAAQAASLNRALLATSAGFAGGEVPAGARGARAVRADGTGTFSFTFGTTAACSPSGSVALAGTLGGAFDSQVQTAEVNANVGIRHQACAVRTDDGSVFTLNGDPKVDVVLHAASNGAGLTVFHLAETGAFTWNRGDGNSGRCTVDVTADLVAGTQSVRLTGTFCGFAVDGTVESVGS
jgi:hypothetical protein